MKILGGSCFYLSEGVTTREGLKVPKRKKKTIYLGEFDDVHQKRNISLKQNIHRQVILYHTRVRPPE